jgi:hypothetical protein
MNLKDDGRGRWQGGPNWPRNGLRARSAAAAAHERLWIGSRTQTGSKPSSLPSLGMLISRCHVLPQSMRAMPGLGEMFGARTAAVKMNLTTWLPTRPGFLKDLKFHQINCPNSVLSPQYTTSDPIPAYQPYLFPFSSLLPIFCCNLSESSASRVQRHSQQATDREVLAVPSVSSTGRCAVLPSLLILFNLTIPIAT